LKGNTRSGIELPPALRGLLFRSRWRTAAQPSASASLPYAALPILPAGVFAASTSNFSIVGVTPNASGAFSKLLTRIIHEEPAQNIERAVFHRWKRRASARRLEFLHFLDRGCFPTVTILVNYLGLANQFVVDRPT